MESVRKNTFYSQKNYGGTLFYVAGYTDSFCEVNKITRMLQEGKDVIKMICPSAKEDQIKTDYINQSRRYKGMRIFYVENIQEADVPEFVFKLGEDWDMWEWLKF